MLIYLADLGHNVITATSDVYPLGVASLATYAEANVKASEPIEFMLFREPEELQAAMDRRMPAILGLSSYSWNHHLALNFARYVKAKDPSVVTLMGGPNFPLTTEEQHSWLLTMPEIDVAVRGPTYEGETAFLAILQRYFDAGMALEGMLESPVPGNMWVDKKSGDLVSGEPLSRMRDLDEIPSPYLAGYMDKFFSTGYFAMMQIARGCPFTCQFCNSSPRSNSKAFRHSLDYIKADLDYIVERIKPESPLCFADDNFGMYKEDEEVADYLGYLMDRYDWPKYIRTTTGKNQGDRIIRVMRKSKGRLPMTSAVQSLNPVVLENIRRSNISLDTYQQIQEEVQNLGLQSYGELILSMPGETKASFMEAVDRLIETGVQRISAHQLMLLHGAPLSNPESREKYGFKTKFRIVARCLGKYLDRPVIETEEMVVETPTFTFQEYLETRVFHLLLTVYYYESNFEEAFKFARDQGIRPYQVIVRLQEMLEDGPAAFRQMIHDYIKENEVELFDSREECVAWAEKNLDALVEGSLGGNLLSKYSMIGRFVVIQDALDLLQEGICSLIEDDAGGVRHEMMSDIVQYYRSVMLHVPFAETLEETPSWTTSYDIVNWSKGGYERPLEDYRCDRPKEFSTEVPPKIKSILKSRIETFGEHPTGLGRFTRTMFAKDLRRQIVHVGG